MILNKVLGVEFVMWSARRIGLAAMTGALLLALVAGCGKTAGEEAGQAGSPPAQAGNKGSEATGAKPAPQEKTVTDQAGHQVKIPADPKRIIGIYLEDELLSLGVTPIKQSRIGTWSGQGYLQLSVPSIDVSGSFEAFLEAGPDLILENVFEEKRYEQLSKMAPMYAFKDARADWKATIRTLGELLGRAEQAEQAIQQYDQKAKAAAAQIKEKIGGQTVAIIRVHTKELRLYGGPGYAGPVAYQDLGLTPARLVRELVLDKNQKVVPLSMELIPQLDADHIFVTTDTGAEEKTKELLSHPLWQGLPAFKNGHVHQVDFETWMKSGPIADSKKIDDIVRALAK